jgi:hypothetical protein
MALLRLRPARRKSVSKKKTSQRKQAVRENEEEQGDYTTTKNHLKQKHTAAGTHKKHPLLSKKATRKT